MAEIGLFQAIATQRAIRRFRPDPVPVQLVRRLIEAAVHAPSGGNRQPWAFVAVRDPDLKRQIGEYYRRSWDASYGEDARQGRLTVSQGVFRSADGLAQHMGEVPVLIFACLDHPRGTGDYRPGQPVPASRYASIYPAVQNLLLAARGLGLGAVLTTMHRRYETEIKALLGIPEQVETCAMIPVGYPSEGETYGPTKRRPVEEVTHWDRWGRQAP